MRLLSMDPIRPAVALRLIVVLAVAGFVGPAVYAETSDGCEPVLYEDFDADEPTPLHAALVARHRLSVVEGEGVGGSNALRMRYVGDETGSRGQVFVFPLGATLDEATLSYDVKFDEDFQFVRGGKLHGLSPETRVTGGNDRHPERWSARVNFRGEGGVSTYIYDQSEGSRWGRSRGADGPVFEKGRYHAVSLHIRLNDPDQANGFAHIYVDGERVVTHEDVQFRGADGENTLIQDLHFSTFHGGNGPQWAPRDEEGGYATVHAYFDNFAVHAGKVVRGEAGG